MKPRWEKVLISAATVLGALALSASSAAAALTFKPAAGLNTGESPASVATGDLDGDGLEDLAVANFSSNSVSVITGKGDGTFRQARAFPTGQSPRAIEVGDFDGDGYFDIATANANSDDVSLLLNSGSGTFGAPISIPVGAAPFAIAKGDLNGDGRPEIVTANFEGSNVSVLVNEGGSDFADAQNFGSGSGPFSVRVADLNNDGRPDLTTADSLANTVTVRLNTTGPNGAPLGFGNPTAFPVGSSPFAVTGADFNGDGRPDLATANSDSDNVSILLGLGAGAFSAPIPFPAGNAPYDLVAADLDGDRTPDVAVANYESDDVTVLPGLGNGSFGNGISIPVGDGPFGTVAGDLNEDGIPDVATADLNAGKASVLINAPTAAVSSSSLGFGNPVAVPKGTVSAPRSVTISNGGSAPLRIEGFTFSGAASNDFTVEGDGCNSVIQPGGSCQVRIRFIPGAVGTRTATLTARTNAASNPTVALSGRAVAFPLPVVTCKSNGRNGRNLKVTCKASWPPNTLSSRAGWSLSRAGVTVRRGSVSTDPDRRTTLSIGSVDSLPGGKYVLRVAGVRAATFELPRR